MGEIKRKYGSLTYKPEKVLLDKISVRIFKYVNADTLSFLGLFGAVFSGICFILAGRNINWLLAVPLGIFLNWFGDSLDGRTARLRNENRPKFGHYFDHLLDILSISCLGIGIYLSSLTIQTYWIFALIVGLLFAIHSFLKTNVTGVFEINMGTEMRIVFIILTLFVYALKNPVYYQKGQFLTLLDLFGIFIFIALATIFIKGVYDSVYGKNRIRG